MMISAVRQVRSAELRVGGDTDHEVWSSDVNSEWNQFVGTALHGHHEQCSWYGDNRESFGFRVDRIELRTGRELLAGAQILSKPTPIGRIAWLRRGPLAIGDDQTALEEVAKLVVAFARRNLVLAVIVDTFRPQAAARDALQKLGFVSRPMATLQARSVAMPLDQSDDDLLGAMTQKGRYNIRIAQRAGVTVRSGVVASLSDFYDLHAMTAAYQGFPVFSFEYYERLWRQFGRSGRLQHFVAYHGDQPVAAICNSGVGPHMIYGWGGVHRGAAERKLMANYLLHFEAMRFARDHGFSHYDLSGIAATRASGPTQFKTRIASMEWPWPAQLIRYFGPLRRVSSWVETLAASRSKVRQILCRACYRLNLRPTMPW